MAKIDGPSERNSVQNEIPVQFMEQIHFDLIANLEEYVPELTQLIDLLFAKHVVSLAYIPNIQPRSEIRFNCPYRLHFLLSIPTHEARQLSLCLDSLV